MNIDSQFLDKYIGEDIRGLVFCNGINEEWIELNKTKRKFAKLKAYLLFKWVYGVKQVSKGQVKEIRPKRWGTKNKSCAKNLSTFHYNAESFDERMGLIGRRQKAIIKHDSREIIWDLNTFI